VAVPDVLPPGLPDGGITAAAFDGRAYQFITPISSANHLSDLVVTELALDGTFTHEAVLPDQPTGGSPTATSPGGGRTLFEWPVFVPLPDAGAIVPAVSVWIQAPDGTACASGAECLSGVCASSVCCSGCDAGIPADAGSTPDAGRAPDAGDGGQMLGDGGTVPPRNLTVACGCGATRPGAWLLLAVLCGARRPRSSQRDPRHETLL
jgi:hypothetical protein